MLHDQYRGAALCAGHEGATSFQRQTYDYARHGVTSLFAALEVATGQVTDACYPRHRHQEFLRFPQKAATACPRTELHVICDNYAAHKHADVRAWLARNSRITLHFIPTGCSLSDNRGPVSAMAVSGRPGYAISAVWSWGGAGDDRARTPEGSSGPPHAGR